MPLMLRMVCYAMARAMSLYYRSLGTVSTLLRILLNYDCCLYHMHISLLYIYQDETAFAY
jgi:hypothetical protein